MNKMFTHMLFLCACWFSSHAYGSSITQELPECRMPKGSTIPPNYRQYEWARAVSAQDKWASGKGDERIKGTKMYEWHRFTKVDLNADGMCDWFVTSSIPLSQGGDRDSINTIYLGKPSGWNRIGASRIPRGQPDGLGRGDSDDQHSRFNYFEGGPYLLKSDGQVFFIGYFASRNTNEFVRPGYQIYVWNDKLKRLDKVDKWAEGSAANEVYRYFKKNNAYSPMHSGKDSDLSGHFWEEIEDMEVRELCEKANDDVAAIERMKTRPPLWFQECGRFR